MMDPDDTGFEGMSREDYIIQKEEDCPIIANYSDPKYCPLVYDGFLCWPRTPAGNKIVLNCPKHVRGIDPTQFVTRTCLPSGRWFSCMQDSAPEIVTNSSELSMISSDVGWTNYTSCWTESTKKLMKDLNVENGCPSDGVDESELKLLIAKISRVLEVAGYSISFLVLFFALVAFCYFRKLRKHKVTRIHMNLFASMILQCVVRLVIYIDQFIVREDGFTVDGDTFANNATEKMRGIDNTQYLCQAFYTLIEYGKTAMFLWMFIEGIILYHMTNVAFSRGPEDQKKFYYSGWLIPIPLVILWAVVNILDEDFEKSTCGTSYSMLLSYWILEGPRIFVIVLNIFILLNVTRVLFTHLRGNEDSDTTQIRKSLKSLLFLLPLLGITNILHHLWPNPLRGSWISFAVWSITTHFLYSFQGLFVACVYFFFDQKVKTTLYTFWILKVTLRDRANSASQGTPNNLIHGAGGGLIANKGSAASPGHGVHRVELNSIGPCKAPTPGSTGPSMHFHRAASAGNLNHCSSVMGSKGGNPRKKSAILRTLKSHSQPSRSASGKPPGRLLSSFRA